jgi:hypothetical protein
MGDHQYGFRLTDKLLIKYSASIRHWRMVECIDYSWISRKPVTQGRSTV